MALAASQVVNIQPLQPKLFISIRFGRPQGHCSTCCLIAFAPYGEDAQQSSAYSDPTSSRSRCLSSFGLYSPRGSAASAASASGDSTAPMACSSAYGFCSPSYSSLLALADPRPSQPRCLSIFGLYSPSGSPAATSADPTALVACFSAFGPDSTSCLLASASADPMAIGA